VSVTEDCTDEKLEFEPDDLVLPELPELASETLR
jgi:hypothetical protein